MGSLLGKLIAIFFGLNVLLAHQYAPLSAISRSSQIEFYSQASQDQFVYLLLYELFDKQDEGYYLEIGGGHPSYTNNTYLFEKKFKWKGISVDIDEGYKKMWDSMRANALLIGDATQVDYRSVLKDFPKVIDYLSLDVDSCYDAVLQRIPFNEHTFKVITIEHDFYRFGDQYRREERKILASLGYELLCPDVSIFFNGKDSTFEDWWIHPSAFSPDQLSLLASLDLKGKSHDQLIKAMRNCLNCN